MQKYNPSFYFDYQETNGLYYPIYAKDLVNVNKKPLELGIKKMIVQIEFEHRDNLEIQIDKLEFMLLDFIKGVKEDRNWSEQMNRDIKNKHFFEN